MTTEADRILRLDAIMLAAGFGARFGGGKLSAPWRGGRLIDGALRTALSFPVRDVVVVTGADAAVSDAARTLGAARLRVVHAADHALGMSASLRAGVASRAPDCDGVFVFLGDMPLVPASLLPLLAEALATGALAAAPFFEGRRGHPVLFGRALFPALVAVTGDEGARAVLRDIGGRLARIATTDRGVLLDVDAPGDLDALG